MKQTWHHLLFAHWPVAAEELEPLVPNPLQLDVFQGKAWIGVVPFDMSGIRLKHLPEIPFASRFAEINVRTYVTIDHKPGVYFFSLDATNWLAVQAARLLYRLPYFYAEIEIKKQEGWIYYRSNRRGGKQPFAFEGKYRPASKPFQSRQGSLEHWLTERYCFYTCHQNRLYRCDILHEPWMLQQAEAEIADHSIVKCAGIEPANVQPLLHYSERKEVLIRGLDEVNV